MIYHAPAVEEVFGNIPRGPQARGVYSQKPPNNSGTPLLWTPWRPGQVSCIERCPHFRGAFILRKHIWDIAKCP